LKECISTFGIPEIINSDQGSQFTSAGWIEYLEKEDIMISMDGRGRASDNIHIERFWRTLKREYLYLDPAAEYLYYYNNQRTHQSLNRYIPPTCYEYAA